MSASVLGSCATLADGIAHVEMASDEAALLQELQDIYVCVFRSTLNNTMYILCSVDLDNTFAGH